MLLCFCFQAVCAFTGKKTKQNNLFISFKKLKQILLPNLSYKNRFLQSLSASFCCLVTEYLPPNMYIFLYFMCCYWFRLKGWDVGLSLHTVTCPLITDYHRLFVLWPVAAYKISHRSWRMLGNSLSGIQHGTGIFGKSNFISTNMRKMKTNTTQTANYHSLGPLSLIFFFFSERHKMADCTVHSP